MLLRYVAYNADLPGLHNSVFIDPKYVMLVEEKEVGDLKLAEIFCSGVRTTVRDPRRDAAMRVHMTEIAINIRTRNDKLVEALELGKDTPPGESSEEDDAPEKQPGT